MRTLLICHHDAPLDVDILARWLASFSDLTGVIIVREPPGRVRRRVWREMQRVGPLRFADVLAFRFFYRLRHAAADRSWEAELRETLGRRYPALASTLAVLETDSANSPAAEQFVREAAPDIVLARVKSILAARVFSLARVGTFVLHPGICPEYRNAHGCFWALARDDIHKVGTTLLQIDRGVDTGPIYGYFSYPYDEMRETHHVIQQRCTFHNLPAIAERLLGIAAGTVPRFNVAGRSSATWGQPWLSRYLRWKRQARARAAAGTSPIPMDGVTLGGAAP